MSKIKIISGNLGGRFINFSNKAYNNADITTSMVKEALFSIIGSKINGANFLDLFSCSGQIGVEAISRGADFVVFNELNYKRFQFIKKTIDEFSINNQTLVLNKKWNIALKLLFNEGYSFDYIFLDPPYEKNGVKFEIIEKIFSFLSEYSILKENGTIIIQHYSSNILDNKYVCFEKIKEKKYGTNSLKLYQYIRSNN